MNHMHAQQHIERITRATTDIYTHSNLLNNYLLKIKYLNNGKG